MIDKLPFLWPEIVLFVTTCVVMVVGLSPRITMRRLCAPLTGVGLLIAGVLATQTPVDGGALFPYLMPFAKVVIAAVGLLILLVLVGTVDRERESLIAQGKARFDALRSNRAEFYAFYLFSLTGLMLCASADDLIWLFLALELTSLPTYVMVTLSTRGTRSQEAGVKYFFLGALGAAIFLYGFALIYGGTGTTRFDEIASVLAYQGASGGINTIAMAGLVMAILGICFKIAAVPMHFYTPDVYQGAASPVSAMLAFVPKMAGFLAILLLLSTVGWQYGLTLADDGSTVDTYGAGHALPQTLRVMLWVIAALTMTVGNVLALLQRSVKRLLAYSSIAHSGYMLVGIVVGPVGTGFTENGLAATLFYLLCYGAMNVGAFAVIASLERNAKGEAREIDDLDELRGLCRTRPVLGWTMVVCALSLMGFPLTLGFFAKLPLFTAAISAGEITLVVVLGLNSAIAALYYLKLVALPMLEDPKGERADLTPFPSRVLAGVVSAGLVIVLMVTASRLMTAAERAVQQVVYTGDEETAVIDAGEFTDPSTLAQRDE